MTIKEFFSFKANKYFWLNLMAMVAVVCLLFFRSIEMAGIVIPVTARLIVVPNVKA